MSQKPASLPSSAPEPKFLGWTGCPSCGSSHVRWQAIPDSAPKVEKWRCYNCGWKRSRKVPA